MHLMEKEIISSMTASLPEGIIGCEQSDSDVWNEIDGLATLRVTRQKLPTDEGLDLGLVTLSVSGPSVERMRVTTEFSQVFGNPCAHEIDTDDSIDVAVWVLEDCLVVD